MIHKTIITYDPMALLEKIADQPLEYPMLAARRIAILSHYARMTAEQQENVRAELAELDAAMQDDCDTVSGASNLSDWEDERNSRPLPL